MKFSIRLCAGIGSKEIILFILSLFIFIELILNLYPIDFAASVKSWRISAASLSCVLLFKIIIFENWWPLCGERPRPRSRSRRRYCRSSTDVPVRPDTCLWRSHGRLWALVWIHASLCRWDSGGWRSGSLLTPHEANPAGHRDDGENHDEHHSEAVEDAH